MSSTGKHTGNKKHKQTVTNIPLLVTTGMPSTLHLFLPVFNLHRNALTLSAFCSAVTVGIIHAPHSISLILTAILFHCVIIS